MQVSGVRSQVLGLGVPSSAPFDGGNSLVLVPSYAGMGSFDFVRLAPHFAQDDRVGTRQKNPRPVGRAVLAFSTQIRKLADVLVERFLDLFFRHVAHDLLFHLAVFEHQKGGDAADSVAHWGR